MKNAKKILSILLSCLMLMSLLSVGVFAAEGTQDNPINANDKWFGYGVDCFLLNTTLDAGDTDGVWYQLTADKAAILQVEHSSTAENATVDYYLTVHVNGREYLGYENGIYNKPVITLPVAEGDVISIHIIAQDTALGGLVYCSAKFITGANDINEMIKLKGANVKIWIANGANVYLQDDSLQGEYAAMGLQLQSSVNSQGITVTSGGKDYTDTDGDGNVELKLGGSAGSAGVPPVKPSFSIKNESGEDAWFILAVVENTAHECNWDDDTDTDCNTCGKIRDLDNSCQHEYLYACSTTCMICDKVTNPKAAHSMVCTEAVKATCTTAGNIAYYTCNYCGGIWDNAQGSGATIDLAMTVVPAGHDFEHDFDATCGGCGEIRTVEAPLAYGGTSLSAEVNGLSIRMNATAPGVMPNGLSLNLSNATVGGYKLVGLGALASNNGTIPTMETVDGNRVLNIPAQYICDFNGIDTVGYAIRIVNIPEEEKDTIITYRPYFIYVNAQGDQQVVYGDVITASYNNP